ncbi:MAG: hypothetical protein WC528_03495 [Patescibacteria group bacterium]
MEKKKLNLQDLLADKPEIKYCCAKQAINTSRDNPKALYPDFDFFPAFLDSDKNVMKWTATIIIGNLSRVDSKNKVDRLIPKLIALLSDPMMITAGNAIKALGEIAGHKPKYREKILKALLSVGKNKYYSKGKISPECTNVAIQQVLVSLEKFGPEVLQRNDVKFFLKKQTKNSRLKVKKISAQLLKNT